MLPTRLPCVRPLAWILVGIGLFPAAARAGEVHLVLLHTNDVHGQVHPRQRARAGTDAPLEGGLARVAACLRAARAEESGPGRALLVVDAGDWYAGTPEGAVDQGLAFVTAMAAISYDAVALGNHEFDHGIDNARRLVRAFGGRAVCANLNERSTHGPVDWIEPWRIVEAGGLSVALVGLLTTTTPEITHEDVRARLEFEDPVVALGAVLARLRALPDPPDLVIPLTHLGVEGDLALAAAFPELPLIVGGHDHRFLEHGIEAGSTLVVQAGARATVVGRVDLWIDRESGRVTRRRARLLQLDQAPAPEARDERVDELCRELADQSDARMAEVVGTLAAPLERSFDRTRTSPAGAWIADVIRARSGADLAIMNRGGVRSSLAAGPITRRDLFELAPFDNGLVAMTLTGAELEACLERAFSGAHSGVDLSGARIELESAEQGLRLAGVWIGGQELEPERHYRVATNSFLAGGGDGYVELQSGRGRVADAIVLRDLLAQEFLARGRIEPPTEARIAVLEPVR